MSDSSDASSHTSRPPHAGHGNLPLWVPDQQHGSEATSGFGLTTHYEPSTNQHQDLRAQHQQFIQTDTNPFHRSAGVPTVNDLPNQPASYPVPTHSAIGAPSAAPAPANNIPTCSTPTISGRPLPVAPAGAPNPPNPPTSGSGQFHQHPMGLLGTSNDPSPPASEAYLHASSLPGCSPTISGTPRELYEHAPLHAPLPGYQPVEQQPQQHQPMPGGLAPAFASSGYPPGSLSGSTMYYVPPQEPQPQPPPPNGWFGGYQWQTQQQPPPQQQPMPMPTPNPPTLGANHEASGGGTGPVDVNVPNQYYTNLNPIHQPPQYYTPGGHAAGAFEALPTPSMHPSTATFGTPTGAHQPPPLAESPELRASRLRQNELEAQLRCARMEAELRETNHQAEMAELQRELELNAKRAEAAAAADHATTAAAAAATARAAAEATAAAAAERARLESELLEAEKSAAAAATVKPKGRTRSDAAEDGEHGSGGRIPRLPAATASSLLTNMEPASKEAWFKKFTSRLGTHHEDLRAILKLTSAEWRDILADDDEEPDKQWWLRVDRWLAGTFLDCLTPTSDHVKNFNTEATAEQLESGMALIALYHARTSSWTGGKRQDAEREFNDCTPFKVGTPDARVEAGAMELIDKWARKPGTDATDQVAKRLMLIKKMPAERKADADRLEKELLEAEIKLRGDTTGAIDHTPWGVKGLIDILALNLRGTAPSANFASGLSNRGASEWTGCLNCGAKTPNERCPDNQSRTCTITCPKAGVKNCPCCFGGTCLFKTDKKFSKCPNASTRVTKKHAKESVTKSLSRRHKEMYPSAYTNAAETNEQPAGAETTAAVTGGEPRLQTFAGELNPISGGKGRHNPRLGTRRSPRLAAASPPPTLKLNEKPAGPTAAPSELTTSAIARDAEHRPQTSATECPPAPRKPPRWGSRSPSPNRFGPLAHEEQLDAPVHQPQRILQRGGPPAGPSCHRPPSPPRAVHPLERSSEGSEARKAARMAARTSTAAEERQEHEAFQHFKLAVANEVAKETRPDSSLEAPATGSLRGEQVPVGQLPVAYGSANCGVGHAVAACGKNVENRHRHATLAHESGSIKYTQLHAGDCYVYNELNTSTRVTQRWLWELTKEPELGLSRTEIITKYKQRAVPREIADGISGGFERYDHAFATAFLRAIKVKGPEGEGVAIHLKCLGRLPSAPEEAPTPDFARRPRA